MDAPTAKTKTASMPENQVTATYSNHQLPPIQPLPMTNILDHVSSTPVLEIDDWPRSATRKEWFAIARRLIQDTIAAIADDLNDKELSLVEQHFIAAGLL